MSKLVLIDGHAILHRAFHALPPTFTNKEGTSTNAVYGFTTMLLRILADMKPDYLIVAFDLPQPTFRQQQYTAYQAKRPEMQGNLVEQIPLVHEMLEALKVPFFEVAGFEADDVIGSLAKQASETAKKQDTLQFHSGQARNKESSNVETTIVTGDRDMLQLVNDRVKVCVPVKGLMETKTYDEKTIVQEFGVKASQWVDVKALKGDASDNYPGVRGIGPKTAQELVAKYGTLENIFRKLGEIGREEERLAKKLAEGAEDAGMAKKLAQIVTDVPVHLNLEKAAISEIDWNLGVKYMKEKLGFKSIPEKIEQQYLNKSNKQSLRSSSFGKLGTAGLKNSENDKAKRLEDHQQLGLI